MADYRAKELERQNSESVRLKESLWDRKNKGSGVKETIFSSREGPEHDASEKEDPAVDASKGGGVGVKGGGVQRRHASLEISY